MSEHQWVRSCWVGSLPEVVGSEVTLNGWLQRRRDLGGLVFLELRERTGVIQVVCPAEEKELHAQIAQIPLESAVAVRGRVVERSAGTVQAGALGALEIQATALHCFNAAAPLPFPIVGSEAEGVAEKVRLAHRPLDLRRADSQRFLLFRHRLQHMIRNYLDQEKFLEVETPILTRSTPEGARDYLVPSRVRPGHCYALPQSPQLFKQLLMVGGVDRYYQVARCFRDEDLRADRQPEFTQLDLEISFPEPQFLQGIISHIVREAVALRHALPEAGDAEASAAKPTMMEPPFPCLTYHEAMATYGTDRPDLRMGLPIQDVSDLFAHTKMKVLASALEKGGTLQAVWIPDASRMEKANFLAWEKQARALGAGGLLWFHFLADGSVKGPLVKHCAPEELAALPKRLQESLGLESSEVAQGGAAVLLAGATQAMLPIMGALRCTISEDLGLLEGNQEYRPLWIVDFPLWEQDPATGELQAMHHPFTLPVAEDMHYWDSDPGRMRAQAFDLVVNGYELGSGGHRIHDPALQRRMLRKLGWSEEAITKEFGFLLRALASGAPPHMGFGLGLDRLALLCLGVASLRDCIAFPKNAVGNCPLTEAPTVVTQEQLDVLGLAPIKGKW